MRDIAEIALVRHGESALPLSGSMTLPEFRDLIETYNRTGISRDSDPDQSIRALGDKTSKVICSDYPRALESASRVAPSVAPQVTPLLREAGRPLSWNTRVRLPLQAWDTMSRIAWRLNLFLSDESVPQAKRRAAQAADVLVDAAWEHGQVVAVGHGTFWRMVGGELLKRGHTGPKRPRLRHWEAAIYQLTR